MAGRVGWHGRSIGSGGLPDACSVGTRLLCAISAFAARKDAGESTIATGTVKWFSDEKGFRFITPDDESRICSSTIRRSSAGAIARSRRVRRFPTRLRPGRRVPGPSTSSWSSDPARLPT